MEVGIVGGGIAGLAAALAFRRYGHDVAVFERASDFGEVGAGIALPPNALRCLRHLGVREKLPRARPPMQLATVRNQYGRVLVRAPLPALAGARDGDFVVAHRAAVIDALRSALPSSCLHPGVRVTRVTADGTVEIPSERRQFDLVIGADGINSVTRTWLWTTAPSPRATGITAWRWIVNRPTREVGAIWGRTAEFGILPMDHDRTYVYGGARRGHADLENFSDWPNPLPELIASREPDAVIVDELRELRPIPNPVKGRVILVGDAAHAMRPTFGQGAALALEDVVTLSDLGARCYAASRRRRTAALHWCSRWGSLVTMPVTPAAMAVRDTSLRIVPNGIFAAVAGLASRWRPP